MESLLSYAKKQHQLTECKKILIFAQQTITIMKALLIIKDIDEW